MRQQMFRRNPPTAAEILNARRPAEVHEKQICNMRIRRIALWITIIIGLGLMFFFVYPMATTGKLPF